MVICVCVGKTEEQVRRAIREGCKTLQKLEQQHRIGKDCQHCVTTVERLLSEEVK